MLFPIALALLPSPALGHAGASLAGVDVHPDPDGVTLYEGNFGLLLQGHAPDAPTRWDWICHEVVTTADALITPRYRRGGDGVLWAVVPALDQAGVAGRAVYRSEDGCDWAPVDGLADQHVIALSVAPDDPTDLVVATRDPGALWRSTDGGSGWSPILDPVAGRTFTTVTHSPAGTVWAAGHDGDGLVVAWSDDGGETVAVHHHDAPDAGDGVGDVTLSIATASPDDPRTAWLVAGPVTGDRVWRTTDGGETVAQVLQVTNDVVDGTVTADGAVWLAEGSRALWRSVDGTDFVTVDGVPLGIGLAVDPRAGGTGVRFTSFAEYTGILMSDIAADGSWVQSLRPPDLTGPLTCRDGTAQREICAPLWEEVQASIDLYQPVDTGDSGAAGDGGDTDGGSDTGTAGGGGCCDRDEGTAAGVLFLVPLLLWRRRSDRAPGTTAVPPGAN